MFKLPSTRYALCVFFKSELCVSKAANDVNNGVYYYDHILEFSLRTTFVRNSVVRNSFESMMGFGTKGAKIKNKK